MKSADLHLHTAFSDGTDAPDELIKKAVKSGLSAVAVTDHDSVDAIPAAIDAGIIQGIEVIPGIELTAEYEGLEVHILGYFIDYRNSALREKLEFLGHARIERIHGMVAKLQGLGVKIDAEKIFELSGKGVVGRLHVARVMVREGIISSTWEAFSKYIGNNGPAYVLGFKFSPQDACKLIRSAGGIPVLAHPYALRRDDLIPQLVKCGIRGLEVFYPEHTNAMRNKYIRICREYKLLSTGGSDYHGSAKPEVSLGSFKVPYELVDLLRDERNKASI
ncbi:MAG: PHP domain-containing protein [Candidatus Omnitrophota bacterium]